MDILGQVRRYGPLLVGAWKMERRPTMPSVDIHPLLLWAKWSKGDSPTYHPLLCHLCDVAAVTLEMWVAVLSPWVRRSFADDLGLSDEDTGRWLAYLSGLHDIGKASPTFQLKVEASRLELQAAGLPLRTKAGTVPHGTVSAVVLSKLLVEKHDLSGELASKVATVVGGHHGVFPPPRSGRCAQRRCR
ncbi:MAG: CRISPR-associated endonuclease Cas3'' [Chloroflexia bacterium]